MRRLWFFVFWVGSISAIAQPNIIRIEYFIDADPGRGNGTSILTASPTINILENVNTASLTLGFHVITVRAEDQFGVWGLPESRPFFVALSAPSSQNDIVAMEYFIDADPGRGLGVAIPITPAINLNILENVPTALLAEGFHLITIRAQDQFGVWGLSESKPFYVNQSTTTVANNITAMEYFIDADPGWGLGVAIPITPAINLNILENVPTASLAEGFHLITVRAQDDRGTWGLSESKPFYVNQSTTTVENNITAMEYFIDADPGRGLGVAIPITPAINLNILENVPTASLAEGFHLITVHAQDDRGTWGISESKPFYVNQSTTTVANNITAMEYFIDADPGRGLGVAIPITPAINLNILENVPTALLTEGFHLITVRAQDDRGIWGLSESKPFYVNQSSTIIQNNIAAMEYFIDADPGRGLGVAIPIMPAINLNILENVPTALLTEGFHLITVRAQDDRGIWGLFESKPFYVNQSSTIIQNNIVAMEYFIDADPGRGLGVAIPITPAINLNILENVPTSPLAEGFHLITVRAQDDRGIWGLSESKPFYVNLSSGAMQNNLINLEYFFDVDPSVGSGITVPLTPAGNINMLQSIATGSLSDGLHVIFIRAQDENNLWGQAESKAFFIDDSRLIVNYEYAIDVDPGIGLAIQQLIVPPQSAIDEPLSIDTNPLAIGGHSLFIRVKDSNLFWSKTNTVTFIVCSGAAANFSVAADCQGNPTTFADLSTNVLVGDAYGWDFDGDGTIDDMTAGNTSYVYAVTGSYLAMLTIDRSGCTSSFTTNVNIVNSATAFTGPDFTICEGSIASLSGSFGGSATSASWSTSGSGTFDDPTSLTAIYAPGPSDAGAGLIPITLTTDDPPGGCVAGISTMNLTVTQRPTANAGSDRPVCPASTLTLSGIIGGTATSSTWMTSGDGLFNNAALLNATYSAGPNDAVSGTFDLTLITDDPDGAGPCTFATSQITVTISQPVSAAPLTTNARVQQVVNLDVISPAAISPGDVVTVNIQQAGAKGLTSIKPDLSIDYIPNPGTVGADLIDFQLCNQCSLCDTERIAITILNEPPVVVVPASPILTQTGTMIQIDLLPLISDLNDNIDFNSIAIVVAPVSQAVAFIDAALTLTVDYSSNQFTGLDNLTIEVCDLMGACVRQVLTIQVEGDLIVHNAISPNGDGLNDYFIIRNINFVEPRNKVSIFNRWGDKVFEVENYDNSSRRFNGFGNGGNQLSSGVYFYKIEFISGRETISGFLSLKK